jgi:CubicO group peptidase (beta-lactamase class C family)
LLVLDVATAVAALDRLVQDAVSQGQAPGAVCLVRWGGEVVHHSAFGQAQTWPQPREMRADTVFDLASLTKPLATSAVALVLADRGALALDEDVTTYLPELKAAAGAGMTYRRLLSHSAGLTAWHPLYLRGSGHANVLEAIQDCGLVYRPGTRVQYSDLGFVVLGIALERITGQRLGAMVKELVIDPCGLRSASFVPQLDENRFAATERGNAFERDMVESAGLRFGGWRDACYPGEVNDGNAHYGLGGVSGNAGLFATADDVGRLGQMWLDGGVVAGRRVISPASVRLATTNQSPDGEPARGLGWVLMESRARVTDQPAPPGGGFQPPTESPWSPRPCGELLSPRAFGHTGFTGTSLWIDPAADLVAVLLTNASHPEVDPSRRVNRLRARFHNALAANMRPG